MVVKIKEQKEEEKIESGNGFMFDLSTLVVVIVLVFVGAFALLYCWPLFVAYWLYKVLKKDS